ncbi:MAG: tetratricopeptide repeat protein [Bacteroidota bacterium]
MAGALLVLAVTLALSFVTAGCGSDDEPAPAPQTPVTTASAEYVGDEVCANCHADMYTSYHETGMGKSVTPFTAADAPERFSGVTPIYNASFDYYYEPYARGDTLYQREFRLDANGQTTFERIHHADYVIGSGNATRSYMMNVNGFVTEMPLTWYVDAEKWDMSPGYRQQNFRFSRPINAECMTCHNGFSAHQENTVNQFEDVALGITCERCHGPASLHVEGHLSGFAPDNDLVKLSALDRERQLSVCQQCHLTGVTVFAPGEDETTFLPGETLRAHRSVFAPEDQITDPERFGIASHGLRLAQSACYIESEMTCTTCHDPHVARAGLERETYSQACLGCHTDADTEAMLVCEEVGVDATADCASCHMAKSGTSDIPHVTFTDHWIRRTPPAGRRPDEIRRVLTKTTPARMVSLLDAPGFAPETPAEMNPGEQALREAVAYFTYYETRHRLPDYLPIVISRAREGLQRGGDSPAGRLVLGRALLLADSVGAAVQVLSAGSQRFSTDARLAYWKGKAYEENRQLTDAVNAYRESAAIQPNLIEAHVALGAVLMDQAAGSPQAASFLQQAREAFAEAVRRNPVHYPEAWNNLGTTQAQLAMTGAGDLPEAAASLDRALALDPDLVEAYVTRAALHLAAGELDAAETLLVRATETNPDYAPAYGNLGVVYARTSRPQAARRMFETVLRLTPGDRQAQAYLDQLR